MSVERRRIEREWAEAVDQRNELRREVREARHAGKDDPVAGPTTDLVERYRQAKMRCKALDGRFFALMELQRQHGVSSA